MERSWTSQELALKYAELEAELAAERADKKRMVANLEGEIERLGKQANDAIYKLTITEAENGSLNVDLDALILKYNVVEAGNSQLKEENARLKDIVKKMAQCQYDELCEDEHGLRETIYFVPGSLIEQALKG